LAPAEAADLRGSLRSQSWAPKPEGSTAHLRRFGRECQQGRTLAAQPKAATSGS